MGRSVPTSADTLLLRQQQQGIVELATEALGSFWSSLDTSGAPETIRDALLRFTPVLAEQYGDLAATVAADWYDELRAAEGVRGRFRAPLAPVVPAEVVAARTRFGAQHLWTDTPGQTEVFLSSALTKYVLQPGRDTITRASILDPEASGWRRVTRAGSCRFCRMLAGRGGVYRKAVADFASHDDCNCAAAPSWDPDAPEVDVRAYEASRRMEDLRQRAAAGSEPAQQMLDAYRSGVRAFVADFD